MERNLFKFVWKYSKRQQVTIVLITLLSFPVLYASLELPKRIINEAIGGSDFPRWFMGVQLDQIPFLLALCFLFLFLVVINNAIKYILNNFKGRTGERMLRRLRYQLFERVLRFRLPHFRKVSPGEIIPMITSEVEPVGGFIGDALATPAFQGGTLVVYIVFIFVQDPLLGAAAIALYPVQGFIIPRLQKRVNALGKQRVRNLRQLSERVGETIGGIREIHANDTAAYHLAEISDKLQTNFEIRYEIYKRKFGIKFLNNFLNQLTPFFFYSIGGYQVIQGNVSFGALVAVLAAYKDLAGPWKELLTYYQTMADTIVKYETVVEQFDPPDIYPAERLEDAGDFDLSDATKITLSNVTFVGDGSGQNVEGVSATVPLKGRTAIVGGEGSGRAQLIQLLCGLLAPSAGRVNIGGKSVDSLPSSVLGRYFAFIDTSPHIFTGTIRQNLTYGLYHRPLPPLDGDEIDDDEVEQRLREARLTGARGYEIRSRWEDLEAAGVASMEELEERAIALVSAVGLGDDVYRMGLQSAVDLHDDADFGRRVLEARAAIRERVLSEPDFGNYVHLWSPDTYNRSASMIENLLFGVPADAGLTPADMARMPAIDDAIRGADLTDDLIGVGRSIAETMVELFSDVSADNDLLSTYSFIPQDEIPDFEAMLNRLGKKPGDVSADDRARLIGLAFMLIPTRHRLGLVTPEIEKKVVAVRADLQTRLDREAPGKFEFFDTGAIVGALSVEDNLLFGRPRLDRPNAREAIERFIGQIVDEQDLRGGIMRSGLAFHVGVGGSRLSSGQKLRIALVRAALSRPRAVLLDEVPGTGGKSASVAEFFAEALPDVPLICGLTRPEEADGFDHVIAMRNGTLVASGPFSEIADDILPQKMAAQ